MVVFGPGDDRLSFHLAAAECRRDFGIDLLGDTFSRGIHGQTPQLSASMAAPGQAAQRLGDSHAAQCLLSSHLLSSDPTLQTNNTLRELRAAKEWSQGDLADRLGVSRQTVNAIETEKYDPSLPLAFKVARLFKLPIEDIFEDDEK